MGLARERNQISLFTERVKIEYALYRLKNVLIIQGFEQKNMEKVSAVFRNLALYIVELKDKHCKE